MKKVNELTKGKTKNKASMGHNKHFFFITKMLWSTLYKELERNHKKLLRTFYSSKYHKFWLSYKWFSTLGNVLLLKRVISFQLNWLWLAELILEQNCTWLSDATLIDSIFQTFIQKQCKYAMNKGYVKSALFRIF